MSLTKNHRLEEIHLNGNQLTGEYLSATYVLSLCSSDVAAGTNVDVELSIDGAGALETSTNSYFRSTRVERKYLLMSVHE